VQKIGLLALAMVLVLGAMGVGFAKWSETIVISGTVTTGDVDVELVKVSGTWLLKLDDHGSEVVHMDGMTGPGGNVISYAKVTETLDEGLTVRGEFDNLCPIPNEDYVIDLLYHYTGSIPVRIDEIKAQFTPDAVANCARVEVYLSDPDGSMEKLIDAEGYQLHECMYILILIIIDGDALQTELNIQGIEDGTFSYSMILEQWNEYADDDQ
jgi:hypothetical protein